MAPPRFFSTPAKFRAWLEKHHADTPELWVGFYKKGSGRPSITWPESVDEALCFGWIDAVRKTIDADAYMIRFVPRRATSVWSNVNLAKVKALIADGRMTPFGIAAYERRSEERSGIYSFERKAARLDPEAEAIFKASASAWRFFEAQPPGYRRLMGHWVGSAKRADTRARRLAQLIGFSSKGERHPQLARPSLKKPKKPI